MPEENLSSYRVTPTTAQYAARLMVDQNVADHCFGVVCRDGKKHFRNYHRPIKNGLTLLDILEVRLEEASDKIYADMIRNHLGDPPTP